MYNHKTHTHSLSLQSRKLTGDSRNQPEGPQDSEGSQSFDVQTSRFPRHVMSGCLLARFMCHCLQDDAEQPAYRTTKPEEEEEGGDRRLRSRKTLSLSNLQKRLNTSDTTKTTDSDVQHGIICITVDINVGVVNLLA